eukprot:655757-Pyramimonas_sp.AAC.1
MGASSTIFLALAGRTKSAPVHPQRRNDGGTRGSHARRGSIHSHRLWDRRPGTPAGGGYGYTWAKGAR